MEFIENNRASTRAKTTHPKDESVKEPELMKVIIAYLQNRGGRAPKKHVEKALFERFKPVFKNKYYLVRVGAGVPRWQKKVQFATSTAKRMKLVKPYEESGRGVWELTKKGLQWRNE